MKKICIVDQDRSLARKLQKEINKRFQCNVELFPNVNQFMQYTKQEHPDMVLIDVDVNSDNHLENIELLKNIQSVSPTTNTIVISRHPPIKKAVEYIRHGAVDCFDKGAENILFEIRKSINMLLNINENKEKISTIDQNLDKMKKQFWLFNGICLLLLVLVYLLR